MTAAIMDGNPLDTQKQVIAEALRDWRQREGLSQTSAAYKLGISYRSLQQYENAEVAPKPSTMRRIIERVGLDWGEFSERVYGPVVTSRLDEALDELKQQVAELQEQMKRLGRQQGE